MNLIFGISLQSSLTLTSDVIFKDDPSSINLTNTNNRMVNISKISNGLSLL
jgi:hypothetical protein